MHDLRAENVAVLAGAMVQSIGQQGEERPAQPLMCWNIEADFGPLEDCRRQPVFHQFFQNYLLLPAANLQEGGKLGGKLDDAMIQKWRPHFDGMGHAHAVAFRQNVVREVVFLVQPEVRRKIIGSCRQSIPFAQDLLQ